MSSGKGSGAVGSLLLFLRHHQNQQHGGQQEEKICQDQVPVALIQIAEDNRKEQREGPEPKAFAPVFQL